MRYIRKVVFIRDRVAKWFPAPDIINEDGTASKVVEPDGKEYFWSDDKIFTDMSSLKDIHGNRQWKLSDGKVEQETDKLTNEQKENETRRRFEIEYPLYVRTEITEDAEEAKLDGASNSDDAVVRFKAMMQKRKEIKVEVDNL
jgi:hypothetical protein